MKFFFVVILSLLPSLGLAQEGEGLQEIHHETDEERALQELESNREQRQKILNSIQKAGDAPAGGPTLDPHEQLEKLGFQGPLNPTALFSDEALTAMEVLIKEAKMWNTPKEEVRQQVLKSFEGNPLEGYVKTSPNLQAFLVDFMRDKEAMLNGIAIFKSKSRLKLYLYFWIGIMFASYYTKRLFVSKYWKRPVKMFASMMFAMIISVITLSTFCLIFEPEMKPIIALVKKHV